MKTERILLMNFLIVFIICLMFGATANAADPGQSFWSLNVGNFWEYSGNLGAYTYSEEVKPKGTSPCSAIQYKVEGVRSGLSWKTTCLEPSLTDLKLCRLEFYYSGLGQFVKIVPSFPLVDHGFTVFKNPITGTWTENIYVDVTIGPLPTIYEQELTSTITVEGQENVTTPLGTFFAYKLHAVQSVTVPVYGTITRDEYGWFVPYLGIVKVEEGGDSEELTSLKIKKEINDLGGDGSSDLPGLTSGGAIYYTTDLQTWTQIPGVLSQLVVGDFDGNGFSDLAGLTSVGTIYYTTNLSNWAQIPGVLNQLVVGDFNGDGNSDMAGLASDGSIWLTTDLSTWTQVPGVLDQLVVGDFDGNGSSDLAGLASDATIWFTTDLSTWTQVPGALDQLVVGDFNGDGGSDLAGLASNGSIWVTTDLSTWTSIPGALSELAK
jgi:hypothetical protein